MASDPDGRRPLLHRIARRFEVVQDVYEARKNKARRPLLMNAIESGGIGAELGVHKGHLTPHLLAWLDPKKLYAVDPWYKLEPEWSWAAGNKSTVDGLRRALKRIESALGDGRAEVVVADDRDWLASLDDGALDWVYIDSSHEYEHTLEELELLTRKVRPQGVIAGDDWQSDPNHRHHGVTRAVREFVTSGRLDMVFSDDTAHQWATRVIA